VRQASIATFALAVTGSALAALGCGRRATDTDCQLIVDRSVELQMKEMSEADDAAIAARAKQVREALGGDIQSCESRRVTVKTMACVRSATSTKDLEACLR
jgi:hypothetical protein